MMPLPHSMMPQVFLLLLDPFDVKRKSRRGSAEEESGGLECHRRSGPLLPSPAHTLFHSTPPPISFRIQGLEGEAVEVRGRQRPVSPACLPPEAAALVSPHLRALAPYFAACVAQASQGRKRERNALTGLSQRSKNRHPTTSTRWLHYGDPENNTHFQFTSRLSLMVPRSLISTATTWGSAANKSFVSQETFPTTTWLARLFSSVTWREKEEVGPMKTDGKGLVSAT